MNTEHHPYRDPTVSQVRCLRHHVWMAGCGNCRAVHAARVAGRRADRARTD